MGRFDRAIPPRTPASAVGPSHSPRAFAAADWKFGVGTLVARRPLALGGDATRTVAVAVRGVAVLVPADGHRPVKQH